MKPQQQTGFTLIEISIVLVIIGLILGAMFTGLSGLRESAKYKQDQQMLQDIKSALLSYVAINGHLPCPYDSEYVEVGNKPGTETRESDGDGAPCTTTAGQLPYADLGTHSVNAYGLPFSYQVNRGASEELEVKNHEYSASYFGKIGCTNTQVNNSHAPCFTKDTPPSSVHPISDNNFTIEDDTGQKLAIHIPAVVISHGHNNCDSSNLGTYELNNCSSTATTFYRAPQNRAGVDKFDDVLIWVSSLEIKNATPSILNPTLPGGNGTGNGGSSTNPPTSDWGSYTPSDDLPGTGLLDGVAMTGQLDSNDSDSMTNEKRQYAAIHNNAKLTLNGDNVLGVGQITGHGSIELTGGNNFVQTGSLNNSSKIYEIAGANGNNSIRVQGSMTSSAEIKLNNGNNRVYISGALHNSVSISFGSGANVLYVTGQISANNPISIDGGTLYINDNIQLGKITKHNGAQVIRCNDPSMNCP